MKQGSKLHFGKQWQFLRIPFCTQGRLEAEEKAMLECLLEAVLCALAHSGWLLDSWTEPRSFAWPSWLSREVSACVCRYDATSKTNSVACSRWQHWKHGSLFF